MFQSKREEKFANLLTQQGRKWQYPAPRFKLQNTTYRPDFYLPEENLYIEVIGSRQAFHVNKNKIFQFKKEYPYINFQVVDYLGKPYPLNSSIKKCLYCKKDFKVKNQRQKFCSKECANKYYRSKYFKNTKIQPIIIKCLYCGKEIKKKIYWQKFCSSKCRLYYYVLYYSSLF